MFFILFKRKDWEKKEEKIKVSAVNARWRQAFGVKIMREMTWK